MIGDLADAAFRIEPEPDPAPSGDSGELRDLSLRATRGIRVEGVALLVAALLTLAVASLMRPIPSVPWRRYVAAEAARAPSVARDYTTATAEPALRASSEWVPGVTRALPPIAPHTRAIDLALLALVALAAARGVVIGTLRAALSIAALAAAVVVVRVWSAPVSHWVRNPSGSGVHYDVAPWLIGVVFGVAVLAAVATFVHVMRQDARARALGTPDRLGGAVFGLAEGVIVAGLLVFVAGAWLGRGHGLLAASRSLALLERSEMLTSAPPDVAAPPSLSR